MTTNPPPVAKTRCKPSEVCREICEIVDGPISLEAVALANEFAPEHLELLVADPWNLLPRVKNAGAVFLGAYTPEVAGDYLAGPNHVLPTGGTARFSSPLNITDFVKLIDVVNISAENLMLLGEAAVTVAGAGGLEGRARAVEGRMG